MNRAGVRLRRRSNNRALLAIGVILALVGAFLVIVPPTIANAAPCDAPVVNEIACENTQPGNPSSEWSITGSGSASIQGFATDISVNRGSTIGFKIKTTSTTYRLDIYRMGYYGGLGARKITTVNPTAFPTQPACQTQGATGLIDCGNWIQTASWAVPSTAVSGIYFAKLVAGSASSHIVFVVRNDSSTSDLFFQTSDTTWQAYNDYGGNSLYEGSPAGRAYKVSYNRPFDTAAETPEDFVWNAEYPMVRFLESNGYNVSYTTGVDTERAGNLIRNHKTFLSVGHDEYWSGNQRGNVEAARDAGVNLAFFSGNEVFWKTRWENGNRTLVSYKETLAHAKIDPAGDAMWTGTWRDPRFSPPGDGGRPENALTGTIFYANCCTTNMIADGSYRQQRFWRNTRVANLAANATTTLGSGILGYEWDESPDNGYRPPGLIFVSTTTRSADYLQDYGSSYAPGTATHHLTLYRASSGALVFGAGTIQWAWGLDNNHTPGQGNTSDTAVKQATVNLFADMGVQPATLQTGLVASGASTDTTAPTSSITAPAAGATVPVGQQLTITGTATDTGGRVAGVEVSVDDGASWHPADGTTSWSYNTVPSSNGTLKIKTRATDDSVRTETPAAAREVTVGAGTQPPAGCPCTIWPSSATPAVAADPDTGQIEVGVKFRPTQNGSITGIRFYKGSGNSGAHTGSLWTSTGTNLATAIFTGESTGGWQQVSFATPVPVTANTTYVASYFAPNGRYSVSDNYFTTAVNNGPLTALADGTEGVNGVYKYGASGFPTTGWAKSNYWVDVVFTNDPPPLDTTAPTVTDTQPSNGTTDLAVSPGTVTATFTESVQPATIVMSVTPAGGSAVAGTVNYSDTNRTATFTPSAALAAGATYNVSLSGAKDTAGNPMSAPVTWSFTTAAAAPTDTTAPTVTGTQPSNAATGVAASTPVTATFSESVQQATIVMSVTPSGGTAVAGTVNYSDTTKTATFTPSAALAAGATYNVSLSGAKDTAGNQMSPPVTWSFTTAAAAPSGCPCSIWPATATPAVASDPDTSGVEVGVKFRASQSGKIAGIRFYKGEGNTGTHVGTLWSRTGTQLARATFTSETGSGWQQVTFATPVSVTAGTTYVASYFAPVGRYSVNEQYFASAATTNGPLTALRNGTDGTNGVYRYGTSSVFPNSSYRSSNYWVDVVFTTS